MAGSVKAMDLCYRVTRRGGTTVTAGLSHPDHRFEVQHVSLVAEERTVKGSYIGSCVPLRDVPRYIALYRPGRLPVDRLMSERLLQIGRALCRERVVSVSVDLGGRRIHKKKTKEITRACA